MNPPFYIIDGSSYIYRAFFAIGHLSNSNNLPTNAIYGFALMLLKVIRENNPQYLCVVFDSKGKNFRHDLYSAYKANRPPMPDDLSVQIPHIKRMVKAFNINSIEKDGYEADDIIGTLVKKSKDENVDITIISGDKDLMQLISPKCRMLDTMKNKVFTEKEVKEKFSVSPELVIDVLALMGDKSDNIPGVPGIGEKSACELVKNFGSIEYIIEHTDKIAKPSWKKKILQYKDQAILSKRLAAIVTDMDIPFNLEDFSSRQPDAGAVIGLLKEYEFNSLVKEIITQSDRSKKRYNLVDTEEAFSSLLNELKKQPVLSIDTETTAREPVRADIVGISLSFSKDEAYYIPIAHDYEGNLKQLNKDYVIGSLKHILEDEKIKKVGQNIKYEIIVFRKAGIVLQGIYFDTMLASYILNPSRGSHGLDALSLEFLNYRKISYKEVAGEGSKQVCFSKVDVARASDYSCEDADTTFQLYLILKKRLKQEGLEELYNAVELPLVEVLAEMEQNGVKLDSSLLSGMSVEIDEDLNRLTKDIYREAGEEFNINSSKQLAYILFEKIGLKPVKRKKTGYSTDVDVLERLSAIHPLPKKLLEFRTLAKLKSTYVNALIKIVNTTTGRIHTSFNQTITATGRLSSSSPNLQNIPIKTELGRKIRKAFIAEDKRLILSSDYSQIELRILAHLSGDDALIASFIRKEDIHSKTASEVMGVFPALVTPEMRRIAKSINFGIIYGISAYGLSRDIGIPKREAQIFIDNYFLRYRKVKLFIEDTVKKAYTDGFVTTLFNRRRYIPELYSSKKNIKEFAERAAVNTAVQGTAADIVKMAMIKIHQRLKKEGLMSRMILQVHDELVFEVMESEADVMRDMVKEEMEHVVSLDVPLVVDIKAGRNWDDAH